MKASERIYSDLRRRLMTGHYAPQTQLKENELAAEYGLSRTPVRVALAQLVAEKLLVAEPNRGVFVAEWTTRDMDEVFGLRRLLEGHAAGLAAERHTPEQLVAIAAINQKMAKASRKPEQNAATITIIQSANNEFHRAILDASGSPRLIGICASLVDTPMIIGSFYLYTREELLLSVQQHDQVISALSTRDYEYASQSMSLHLRSSYERYRSKGDAGQAHHHSGL